MKFNDQLEKMRAVLHDLNLLDMEMENCKLSVTTRGCHLEADARTITPNLRRRLKAALPFEVGGYPGWRYLTASVEVEGFTISCDLVGTYECRPNGETPVPPSLHEEEEAAKLEEMTPEQARSWVLAQARKLRAGSTKTNWVCEPTPLSQDEPEPQPKPPVETPADEAF